MKVIYPYLRLIAVLPCEAQADNWSFEQQQRYFNILANCDEVIALNSQYTKSCMFERNRYLVNYTEYLLAVYDGSSRGGTAYTVRYAKKIREKILQLLTLIIFLKIALFGKY